MLQSFMRTAVYVNNKYRCLFKLHKDGATRFRVTYAYEFVRARRLTFARDALVVEEREEEPVGAAESGFALQHYGIGRMKRCVVVGEMA